MLRHLEWRGETMGKVDAAKAGDFLFRYMVARHKCKHMAEPPPPAARLADLIEQGKREFDEIYVEPEANVPIAGDDKHHDLFAAIIKRDNSAMLGLADLAYWRNYVHFNGPIPKRREAEPAFAAQRHNWARKLGTAETDGPGNPPQPDHAA
jgi:hypothetical protein